MIINAGGHTNSDNRTSLLWENSSPSSTFEKQTINIDFRNYQTYYIMFYVSTTIKQIHTYVLMRRDAMRNTGSNYGIDFIDKNTMYSRSFLIKDSGIEFDRGTRSVYSSDGSSGLAFDNQYIIPYRIYGSY